MTNEQKQKCVDLMGETLFELFQTACDKGDYATSNAIYEEWMVDGRDPEDGEYEFMFINDLTEVWYALQQRDKKH